MRRRARLGVMTTPTSRGEADGESEPGWKSGVWLEPEQRARRTVGLGQSAAGWIVRQPGRRPERSRGWLVRIVRWLAGRVAGRRDVGFVGWIAGRRDVGFVRWIAGRRNVRL